MTTRENWTPKKMGLWALTALCGLLAVYLGFISLVSVWVGLAHTHQACFWVPVLAGFILLAFSLYAFFRLTRRIMILMREEPSVNI